MSKMVREIDIKAYEGKPISGSLYLPGNQRLEITANPTGVLTVNGLEALYFSFIGSDKSFFQWPTHLELTAVRPYLVAYCNEYLTTRNIDPASFKADVVVGDRIRKEVESWQKFSDLEQRSMADSYFPDSALIMADSHPNLRVLVLKYYRERTLETHLRVPAQVKDVDALTALVFQTSNLRFKGDELSDLQGGIKTLIEEAEEVRNVYKLR